MLMIKCNKGIMDIFENRLSETDKGYNENGVATIRQLENINKAISCTGLEKRSKIKVDLKQKVYPNGNNFFLRCSNEKLDMNSAALYYCAFCIKAGLHPVIIYSSEYVFIGVWMDEEKSFDMSYNIPISSVRDSLYPEKGDLLLIDSWNAINSDYDFWNSLNFCKEKIPSIRKVIDFSNMNKGNTDCIILDDSPYITDKLSKTTLSCIASEMTSPSVRPSRNFRNVHFCDISEYDMAVSDMIQKDNSSYFIKNIEIDKQAAIASDAALNIGCQNKNVLLLCDDDNNLSYISGVIDNTGLNLNPCFVSVAEDDDYFDMGDDESGIETLQMIFSKKKRESFRKEKDAEKAEQIEKFTDTSFNDKEMSEFYRLADTQEKLRKVPKGSKSTLLELLEAYYKNYDKNYDLDESTARLRQEIDDAVQRNYMKSDEMLEHIKKFAELRKKCILRFGDKVFDVAYFDKNDIPISKFKYDIKKIRENWENLNKIYRDKADTLEDRFSFEDMDKYNEAFKILLGLDDSYEESTISYDKYRTYLKYSEKCTYFSGGDVNSYLEEYSLEKLEELGNSVNKIMKTSKLSHDGHQERSYIYSLLKKIVSHDDANLFNWYNLGPNKRRDEILNSFSELIVLRKEIHNDISVLKDINEIFGENVREEVFSKQCAWLEHYMNIGRNSAVAEKIAKDCCSASGSLKDTMTKYFKDISSVRTSISKGFWKYLLKYLGQIEEFLDEDTYEKYLSEKQAVTEYGIPEYAEKMAYEHDPENSVDEDLIDKIRFSAEKYMIRKISLKFLSDSQIDIKQANFDYLTYERKLKDLKKHYSYLITHEKPSQPHVIACTLDQLDQYKDYEFDRIIMCGTENISCSSVEQIISNIRNRIFMSGAADTSNCSKDSVAFIMANSLNSFDYSEYTSEES